MILSRGRSKTITTTSLFPDWVEILVPDTEIDQYKATVYNPLIAIPDTYKGLGQVRNYVLDNIPEETVVMIDDDLRYCYSLTGYRTRRIKSPTEVVQIIINTAVMAKESGAKCFGFSQTDIRKYHETDPFNLCTWVGGVIGVIGRDLKFRDDKYKVDIDFCLQNLLVNRIVWCDSRYTFAQERDNNIGGNSSFRNKEEFNKSVDTLKEKWGNYIRVKDSGKSQITINLNVKRKQKIVIE